MGLQNFSSNAQVNWHDDRRGAWQLSIAMAAISLVMLVALFWDTVTSAIRLWWEQPTYNYAFLILPISAYLIWRKREEVRIETPVGSFWGTALTASFALLWLVSDAAEINEGRHIAFIGMVLGVLLASFGWSIFKILLFPLLYLWLLVPTGTVFLPLLQQVATFISAEMVRWLGIPVYADGFFIDVPSGRYHIEPGCAGLNFILAAAALAPLYAYLFYRSFWKRLIAVVLALILAIIMNGVRIAGIIALAHWGGPRLNIVDDHLLYGWGFFTLVLLGAGYVGSFFADVESAPTQKKRSLLSSEVAPNTWFTAIAASLAVLAVVTTFVLAKVVAAGPAPQSFNPLPEINGWLKVASSSDWSPVFSNADVQVRQSYLKDGETIDLFIAGYGRQAKGREMIAYDNRIVDAGRWSNARERRRTVDLGTKELSLEELVAASGDERHRVWLFYWVGGSFTADPIVAKLLEIKAKLLFGDQRAAIIAIATSDPGEGNADHVLRSFLKEALPSIETLLSPIDTLLSRPTTGSMSPSN